MAKVQLGSKHGRPSFLVESSIDSHPQIVDDAGEQFYGSASKRRYASKRYVPFVISGEALSRDDAVKNFTQFVDSLEAVSKSDGVTIKDANGGVLYDGDCPAMPLSHAGQSAGSYALTMIQRAYILAHQNDMRAQNSERALTDARKAGLLKPEHARARGTRGGRDTKVV